MHALENLARTNHLIREPTSAEEISGFLMRAEQQLIDARTASLSPASRFSLAYDAAHRADGVALRAIEDCAHRSLFAVVSGNQDLTPTGPHRLRSRILGVKIATPLLQFKT